MRNQRDINGVLLIDKPDGMTSHDVVDRLRKITGVRRIGHAGTLDPMATGLLVVCIGRATRAVQFLVGLPKEYIGTIALGAISSTYDAEGQITEQPHPLPETMSAVADAMRLQHGLRLQLAPPYSAVKVKGRKLYEYAREGRAVPQKSRRVHIQKFDPVEYQPPNLRFYARVGSGTYIRSMAHDLGVQLGCGAYLAELRRTSVGNFHVDHAVPLPRLMQTPDLLPHCLLGLADALAHLPRITVGPEVESALLNGRGFTSRDILNCETLPRPDEASVVLNSTGSVVSVVRGELIAGNAAAGEPVPESAVGAAYVDRPLFFRPIRVLGQP